MDSLDFFAKLTDFPHSFQLKDQDYLPPDGLQNLRIRLEAALQMGHRFPLEQARAHNLLAFVYSRLGQPEEAVKELDKALELDGQKDNIVSLANKAVVLWQLRRQQEADEQVRLLQQLQELADFDYLIMKAKAELADSYLRFGDHHILHFIPQTFEEVIQKGREILSR